MLDSLYTFITTYPASLPVFFLIVCAGVLGSLMTYDWYKEHQGK